MSRGIPYTVSEARKVANGHQMDIYHKELMLWLCGRVEALEKQIEEAEENRQDGMDAEYVSYWSELP